MNLPRVEYPLNVLEPSLSCQGKFCLPGPPRESLVSKVSLRAETPLHHPEGAPQIKSSSQGLVLGLSLEDAEKFLNEQAQRVTEEDLHFLNALRAIAGHLDRIADLC